MDVSISRAGRRGHELAIALHCSGSSAAQWRLLGEMLGEGFELVAPEHYDSGNAPAWGNDHAFTLADEAARTIALIDSTNRKVHLVGHSYGGGVALHVALYRADRIASLTLYEPSAFYLLKQLANGGKPFAEIKAVADSVAFSVITGDRPSGARDFVDYWGGGGTWDALRPSHQQTLIRWLPKVTLEFTALLNEPTSLSAFMDFGAPVLIVRGEHAPAPTRLISDTLPSAFPVARLAVVAGAGHMGPLTHGAEVNALIVQHILGMSTRPKREAA